MLTCFPLEARVFRVMGYLLICRSPAKLLNAFISCKMSLTYLNSPYFRVLKDRFPLSRKKQYPESKKSNLQDCNSKVSTTWIHNISEPKTSLRIILLGTFILFIYSVGEFKGLFKPLGSQNPRLSNIILHRMTCVYVCSVVSDSL